MHSESCCIKNVKVDFSSCNDMIGCHIRKMTYKFRHGQHGQNSSECVFIWPHAKALNNGSSTSANFQGHPTSIFGKYLFGR